MAIPVSFVECLRKVKIQNLCDGQDCEFKFVEYLLQNGKALEKITLDTLPDCMPKETQQSFLGEGKLLEECLELLLIVKLCHYCLVNFAGYSSWKLSIFMLGRYPCLCSENLYS